MSKKAITPIISTILLLSFAVGLGTLVMSWGNSEQHKSWSCSDVAFSITEINSSKQICLENSILNAVFENNGNLGINGIEMIILTSDSVITKKFDANINPREFRHMAFPLEVGDISKILKIRVIPDINGESCIEKRIDIERIAECK